MIAGMFHHVRQWTRLTDRDQNLCMRIGLRKGGGRKPKKKMNRRTKWPVFQDTVFSLEQISS